MASLFRMVFSDFPHSLRKMLLSILEVCFETKHHREVQTPTLAEVVVTPPLTSDAPLTKHAKTEAAWVAWFERKAARKRRRDHKNQIVGTTVSGKPLVKELATFRHRTLNAACVASALPADFCCPTSSQWLFNDNVQTYYRVWSSAEVTDPHHTRCSLADKV
eukprot:CAMPEP_0194539414 /NCGR_PEP_ID=MMETSP0253-20130528/79368_1 /TAXON_ID=2966 /ORGANISM="Noctiluca scintillans" /LENGTH=161 /DNA_ID=CAMNT_0039385693 /DNA_START=14 /DNA_END=499 /DNA_ORIENTATION=-